MIHRSGTSFATPIAAAIASIVLGVMDNVDASSIPEGLLSLMPRLRTRWGMERVLCETCVRKQGSKRVGFYYITPWYFLGIEEQVQVYAVLRILMDVPEWLV